MENATEVLVSGDSAGGLATLLHADQIGSKLAASAPSLTKFRALPISGYFPPLDSVEGAPVFSAQMKSAFETHNASAGVQVSCLDGKSDAEKWQCNTSPEALRAIKTPLLLLQSAYDAWSTSCIYTLNSEGVCGGASGWGLPCVGDASPLGSILNIYGPSFLCSPSQVNHLNEWRSSFLSSLRETGVYDRNGSGAFIHTCHTHTAENLPNAQWIQVGGVKMKDAVTEWWRANVDEGFRDFGGEVCEWDEKFPHQCNPTCVIT